LAERGLSPIDRDFNKIAKHIFDRDIGEIHGKEPVIMGAINKMFGDSFSMLEINDCSSQHKAMFVSR
jgi:hypothetical protein